MEATPRENILSAPQPFSPVGPTVLARLFRRFRRGRPQPPSVRLLLWLSTTFLPLVVLSMREGIGDARVVALWRDVPTLVRLLIALPVLVAAEPIIDWVCRTATSQLLDERLLTAEKRAAYERVARRMNRWRDSIAMLTILIALAYGSVTADYLRPVLHRTWEFETMGGTSRALSSAGYWYLFVSAPLFRLMMLLWLWRIFIWGGFLFGLARRVVTPQPLHPDGFAGLEFIARAQVGFALLGFAVSSVIAGSIWGRIALTHQSVRTWVPEVIATVVLLMLLLLAPLMPFTLPLLAAKRRWFLAYEGKAFEFAQSYAELLRPEAPRLGDEISLHCDLSVSFNVVRTTRVLLMPRNVLASLLLGVAVPFGVLYLSETPLEKIIQSLGGLLL